MRAFVKKILPALLCVMLLASSTYLTEAQTSAEQEKQRQNEKYDRLNNILRKNLTPEAFRSESYRRNVANLKEPQETADITQMRRDFYMGEDVKVYVVKREFFNYFLIEEKGSLRVFTLSLRTKDRL